MPALAGVSSVEEMQRIASILQGYLRLPFGGKTIPGAVMEHVLAFVRGGEVLPTYDFVDVIARDARFGWQVKATKRSTPVTWKRAKIPNKQQLIAASHHSSDALQDLGIAIIEFCNSHAYKSLDAYGLDSIAYARLVVDVDEVVYFERPLIDRDNPYVFVAEDFIWRWSEPKQTRSKEQLPALHGIHQATGDKWFAWHGLSEN